MVVRTDALGRSPSLRSRSLARKALEMLGGALGLIRWVAEEHPSSRRFSAFLLFSASAVCTGITLGQRNKGIFETEVADKPAEQEHD